MEPDTNREMTMSATTSTYQIVSCKTRDSFTGDLDIAIAKAKEIAEEYQPAYGIRVELDGETVWDSEEPVDSDESEDDGDECLERDAQDIARRVLANREPSDWREAGYASALDAARVLVGTPGMGQEALHERAAEIVAEAIEDDGDD